MIKLHKLSKIAVRYGKRINVLAVAAVCAVGIVVISMVAAAGISIAVEPESGAATAPATVVSDSTASGGRAIKFGQASAQPPTGTNIYRPISITSPLQLPHAPRDANYVMWNFPAGTRLHEAFQRLGPNDILVLPERAQPYEIDSSRGFVVDGTRWNEMARAKRGLVGLGPGVIIQPSASSFSLPRSTSTAGNYNVMLKSVTNGGYFGNFEMRGRTFGQAAYDALQHEGSNSVWERIYFNGAHRGWRNFPPGETGAVSGYKGSNQQVYNVEVDCRDPATGARVATSPFMFNAQSNVRVDDFYGHHAYAGMPTFWKVTNITTNRLRAEYNGTGGGELSGQGINHEIVAGTVTHNDPRLILGHTSTGGRNTGYHIAVGDHAGAMYYINRPVFDQGPAGAGVLSILTWGTNQPPASSFRVTNASGGTFPSRVF